MPGAGAFLSCRTGVNSLGHRYLHRPALGQPNFSQPTLFSSAFCEPSEPTPSTTQIEPAQFPDDHTTLHISSEHWPNLPRIFFLLKYLTKSCTFRYRNVVCHQEDRQAGPLGHFRRGRPRIHHPPPQESTFPSRQCRRSRFAMLECSNLLGKSAKC